MADFTKYITTGDERWDTVSQNCYGTPLLFLEIAEANPSLALDEVIAGGTELLVPVKYEPDSDKSKLPPWKQ